MKAPHPHTSTEGLVPAETGLASRMALSEEELALASLPAAPSLAQASPNVVGTQAEPEPSPALGVQERTTRPAPGTPSSPAHRAGFQLVATVLQLGGMALLAYLCLFNFSIVRGSSMAPRIHDGDRILIDHVSYLFDPVKPGDIVVLKYPLDPSVDYIKRVIGLPGDEVVLEGGHVWVNGVEVQEPYVDDPDPLTRMTVHVKAAHFFVLGDNRQRSCDSREFGLVPQDYVRGKVEMRVWPLQRIGLIDS